MSNPVRQHGPAAKFLLQRFANENGQVAVSDKKNDRYYSSSTKNIGVISDYYTINQLDNPYTVEKEFANIEGKAAGILAKILDKDIWPLPQTDRLNLSAWMAATMNKDRDLMNSYSDSYKEVIRIALKMQGHEIDPSQISGTKEQAIIAGFHSIDGVSRYFMDRQWALVKTSLPLFTGETVISLAVPNRDGNEVSWSSTGIGIAECGFVPIDRYHAIYLSDLPYSNKSAGAVFEFQDEQSQAIHTALAGVNHTIYCNPEDKDLFFNSEGEYIGA